MSGENQTSGTIIIQWAVGSNGDLINSMCPLLWSAALKKNNESLETLLEFIVQYQLQRNGQHKASEKLGNRCAQSTEDIIRWAKRAEQEGITICALCFLSLIVMTCSFALGLSAITHQINPQWVWAAVIMFVASLVPLPLLNRANSKFEQRIQKCVEEICNDITTPKISAEEATYKGSASTSNEDKTPVGKQLESPSSNVDKPNAENPNTTNEISSKAA